jgi:hypothetical protein
MKKEIKSPKVINDEKYPVTKSFFRVFSTPKEQNLEIYPGIFVAGDDKRPEFYGEVVRALKSIESKPVGSSLLKTIALANSNKGKKVVIEETTSANQCAIPVTDTSPEFRKKLLEPGSSGLIAHARKLVVGTRVETKEEKNSQFLRGEGSDVVIRWNPNLKTVNGIERPPFIALAHELVHANHFVEGTCFRELKGFAHENRDSGLAEEEMRTVGLNQYKAEPLCENAIRQEHGIPLRTQYCEGNDMTNVQATTITLS